MDPLDFTVTVTDRISLGGMGLNHQSRIRVTALITPEVLAALKVLRRSRRINPSNTEGLLGDLLEEMCAPFLKSPRQARGTETLATKAVRWALAEALIASPPLTRAEISDRAKVSTASAALAVKALEGLGFLTPELGRSGRRPVEVYKLTPLGISISAKDHPDESVRFVLAGMLPEDASIGTVQRPGENYDQFIARVYREKDPDMAEALASEASQPEGPPMDLREHVRKALERTAKAAVSDEDQD